MKKLTLMSVVAVLCLQMNAQQPALRPLSIGDTVPDVYIDSIYNPITKEVESARLSQFNDQVVIFDFWATWCGPCIAGMPKLDSLQQDHEGKVKIIPVTREDERLVAGFFEKRQDLSLSSVVNDKYLNTIFPNRTIPHAVILDKNHKVVAITNSAFINRKVIDSLLDDKRVQLAMKLDLTDYKEERPYIIGGNAQLQTEKILFSSVVTKRIDGIGSSYLRIYDDNKEDMGFHYSNLSVIQLFLYAMQKPLRYVYSRVYLENVMDSSRYIQPISTDENKNMWALSNLFSYEIVAPFLTEAQRSQIMFQDLSKAFGDLYNLKVSWEKRMVPCLVLKKLPQSYSVTQATETGSVNSSPDPATLPKSINQQNFISAVENLCRMPLVINNTLKETLQFQLTDEMRFTSNPGRVLKKFNELLAGQGLQLQKTRHKMEVLVLKETN